MCGCVELRLYSDFRVALQPPGQSNQPGRHCRAREGHRYWESREGQRSDFHFSLPERPAEWHWHFSDLDRRPFGPPAPGISRMSHRPRLEKLLTILSRVFWKSQRPAGILNHFWIQVEVEVAVLRLKLPHGVSVSEEKRAGSSRQRFLP